MSTAADRLRALYTGHGEKLRFLIVGVWNTAFAVVLFNALLLLGGQERYLVLYWVSWVCGVIQSTASMKFFAFRSSGGFWRQTGRAYFIYLPALGLSTLLLWFAVAVVHMSPQLAQLIAIFVTTVFSYFGHKYFTFRVPLAVGEVPSQALVEKDDAGGASL